MKADPAAFRMRATDLVQRVPALTERNFKSWRLRIVMVLNAMGLASYLGLVAMAEEAHEKQALVEEEAAADQEPVDEFNPHLRGPRIYRDNSLSPRPQS